MILDLTAGETELLARIATVERERLDRLVVQGDDLEPSASPETVAFFDRARSTAAMWTAIEEKIARYYMLNEPTPTQPPVDDPAYLGFKTIRDLPAGDRRVIRPDGDYLNDEHTVCPVCQRIVDVPAGDPCDRCGAKTGILEREGPDDGE